MYLLVMMMMMMMTTTIIIIIIIIIIMVTAVGQVLLPVLMFSPVIILPMFYIHIHLPQTPVYKQKIIIVTMTTKIITLIMIKMVIQYSSPLLMCGVNSQMVITGIAKNKTQMVVVIITMIMIIIIIIIIIIAQRYLTYDKVK